MTNIFSRRFSSRKESLLYTRPSLCRPGLEQGEKSSSPVRGIHIALLYLDTGFWRSVARWQGSAILVFRFDDTDNAISALKDSEVKVLTNEEVVALEN